MRAANCGAHRLGLRDRRCVHLQREAVQAAREAAREQHEGLLIQHTRAALALAEATAVAVQRIPDAHCNGDMHAALEYARKVKHAQKDFLTEQGVKAIY